MKTQNRNGVLGLETAKAVMVTFLVLAVIGIATLLCLTALNDGVGDTIDNDVYNPTIAVTNETGSWANITDYTLDGYNSSWSTISLTALWNATDDGEGNYNLTLGLGNASLSTVGVVTNGTTTTYDNVSLSYTYVYTYTVDTGKVDSVVGNVSSGLVTFFGSTGTIFSILIVVVIILAISIIIWAVGRFGQTGRDQNMNL